MTLHRQTPEARPPVGDYSHIESGLDYGVEADEYRAGGRVPNGAGRSVFLYVLPGVVDAAHDILRRNGYKPYDGLLTGILYRD